MITKKTLDKYGCDGIGDYFNCILDSRYNGQIEYVGNLINDMSRKQQLKCIYYFTEINNDDTFSRDIVNRLYMRLKNK